MSVVGKAVGSSTSRDRVYARNFTKRRSDADDHGRDGYPAPDNVHRASSSDRWVEGCCKSVGDRGKDKGHEGDLEG